MANDNRQNYFLLLGIDPDDPWDGAALATLLRAKRNEWSRTVLNGVRASSAVLAAQTALDGYEDVQQVMADPALRERERADARRRLANERERRRVDFERELRIMLGKGFLWDVELGALRRNYPDLVGEPEVAKRLDLLPTHVITEQHVVPDRLDPATANRIRGLLGYLGEKSLYTLLATVEPGVGVRATLERLSRAANTLYQQTRLDMNKQDPKLMTRQELAGHAMQVFRSAHERSRYDNSLALAPVDDLITKYQSALAAIRRFEPGQVEQFLSEASSVGVNGEVALAMLLKHFGQLKWTVPIPATAQASRDQVRCGVCQSGNDTENQFCVVCSIRLRITCPRCSRTVPGHGACGKDGFPVGDYDWAALLVSQCEELADRQDLAGATEKLESAARAWPSEGEDELAVRVRQCRARLAGLREQRAADDENTARQLRMLIEQRNCQAALNRATNARVTVPERERVVRESTEHIREADRLCDLAERSGMSMSQRMDHYTQALTHCADHRRARIALEGLPPEPPRDLYAESVDNVVHLTWSPSKTDNIRYVVVRKRGARPPATVADGSRITTVRRTTYDDRTPESGMPLHYAVFAQRATGTTSEHGAATSEPIFLTDRVIVTAQRVDDGVVELEWRLPLHATGVVVERTAAGTTTEVTTTEPTRLRDEGLANGVSHTYTLRACYSAPDGSTRRSAGVSVTLVPERPPAPPGPVYVRTVTRNLGVCYRLVDLLPQGATAGTANVLWTQHRPPIRPGEQHPITDLATYGSLLTETAGRSFALPRPGLYYFVQVLIQHGIGYVGDIRRYAARDEVGGLSAQDLGETVRVTWEWPDGCAAALVAYDHDDWPPDPTATPYKALVERVGNDRTGWYDITVARPESERRFFFVVASAERRDDELFVATGARCTAQLALGKPGRSRKGRRRKRR